MPVQRLKVAILPLDLPCSGPVTHFVLDSYNACPEAEGSNPTTGLTVLWATKGNNPTTGLTLLWASKGRNPTTGLTLLWASKGSNPTTGLTLLWASKGSNPTTGLTLLWARNPFRGDFNHWQISPKEAG